MIKLPVNTELILFDGVCNLCQSSVKFVVKHDKTNRFLFASLQGNTGQQLIKQFNIDTAKTDSIILYKNNRLYFKSTAALKIASKLNFPINLLCIFLVIPSFIRNWIYTYIAKNRYKWFGKQEACMIPTPNLKAKFLD